MKVKLYVIAAIVSGLLPVLVVVMGSKRPVEAYTVDAGAAMAVSITEGGLDPKVVTVTVGSEVVWTNQTDHTVRLFGGELHKVYLPLVLVNVDGATMVDKLPAQSDVTTRQDSTWLNVEVLPGQSYTRSFATAGDYPYFAMGNLVHAGQVVVEEAASLFESVLHMAEETGAATIADNSSLDVGVGSDDDFTLEMFFYVPDLSYDDSYPDVLARKNDSFEFYILFNHGQPDWIFFNLKPYGYGWVEMGYQCDIQLGWHHVAAVFDNEYTADEDALTIFLDGARVAHSPDEGIHVDWTPGIPNSSRPLEIGGVQGGLAGFYGYLEEVRISDVVRYSGATYTIPNGPFAPDAHTRALWHFDESTGTTMFMDASSRGNHLTGYDGAQTYRP
ncbi:MAG: LamG domain-containing protein [Anaerolineae bacterium]|nr:LamG domain-containing protein [Anaerolineae bacterium]